MIKFYSFKILINDIERTDRVLWRTFSINDEIDDTPNICSFELNVYGDKTYKPDISDDVKIYFNNSIYFSGKIIQIENSGNRFAETLKIKVKDNTILLDKILITARYSDLTIKEIIDYIIGDARFFGAITSDNVEGDVIIKTITFNAQPASKCIQKLASQINYNWYIDEENDIHFFQKNSIVAPFSLTTTSHNYLEDSLKFKEDISQLKNFITVRGGEKISEGSKTTTTKGDGTTLEFSTISKFFEKPQVYINAVEKTVGVEYLDEEADFDCFWSYNEKKIRFKVAPSNTDIIQIVGFPLIPILRNVEDAGSISKYGRYEFKTENKSIRSDEEALQYALAQLESYANGLIDFEFETYDIGLRSGQTLSVNTRGIVGDFIIQSIEFSILAIDYGEIENLQTTNYENILDALSNQITLQTTDLGYLVLPFFKVRCASAKILTMIYFLQKLLLRESDNLEIDENQLLELLQLDAQNVIIQEEIVKDPFGAGVRPSWVLGYYYPTDPYLDNKRTSRLINGKFRINPLI